MKKYRIAWKMKDGRNSGAGEYLHDERDIDGIIDFCNKEYPDVEHFRELDKEPIKEQKILGKTLKMDTNRFFLAVFIIVIL